MSAMTRVDLGGKLQGLTCAEIYRASLPPPPRPYEHSPFYQLVSGELYSNLRVYTPEDGPFQLDKQRFDNLEDLLSTGKVRTSKKIPILVECKG